MESRIREFRSSLVRQQNQVGAKTGSAEKTGPGAFFGQKNQHINNVLTVKDYRPLWLSEAQVAGWLIPARANSPER